MDELVRYIATNLVDQPDAVKIEVEEEDENTVIIKLSVAADDMGKVIGKQGRIAKAIRTIIKAASVQEEKKYILEIV